MRQTAVEERPSCQQRQDQSNRSTQTRSPPPVSFAVGIAVLRHRFQTVRHQSSKRHARKTSRRRRIVPAAAKVATSIGKCILDVFHNSVEGDNYSEQDIEMPPSTGTVPPAEYDNSQQDHVLIQSEVLVGRTVGLRLGCQVL